jgi:hypothetical protein
MNGMNLSFNYPVQELIWMFAHKQHQEYLDKMDVLFARYTAQTLVTFRNMYDKQNLLNKHALHWRMVSPNGHLELLRFEKIHKKYDRFRKDTSTMLKKWQIISTSTTISPAYANTYQDHQWLVKRIRKGKIRLTESQQGLHLRKQKLSHQ